MIISKGIRFVLMFFLIMVCFHQFSHGQYNPMKDVEGFKKSMQTESQKTVSIACDFTQERHLSAMTKPLVSKGKFWFKKPSSVRWEYRDPYETLIILSKRKVFVKEDSKQQEYDMQSGSAFQNMGQIMFSFILGDISNAEKDFLIDYMENTDLFFVRLVPKVSNPDEMVKIELYFDKNDYSLAEIVMFETINDFTRIRFTDKVLNGAVSSDLFNLK